MNKVKEALRQAKAAGLKPEITIYWDGSVYVCDKKVKEVGAGFSLHHWDEDKISEHILSKIKKPRTRIVLTETIDSPRHVCAGEYFEDDSKTIMEWPNNGYGPSSGEYKIFTRVVSTVESKDCD